MSNNLTLSAVELKTAKAKGLGAITSNVVEDLSSSVQVTIGDAYWSTSSMTKATDGMTNSKKLVYLASDGKVITKDPVGSSSSKTLDSGFTAIPACKIKYRDYDYAQIGPDTNTVVFKTPLENGSLLLENPHLVDAEIVCSAYRCSSDVSAFCCAMITKEGANYKLSYKTNSIAQGNKDLAYTSGTLNLFINETEVIVVETKDDGVVNIHNVTFNSIGSITTVAMATTGLTGKIGVISSSAPVFYGYKADGLYSVTGTGSQTKIVTHAGITGIAVFTDYGDACEAGYIYRESDGSTCRDNTGKRTDTISGTMINDYNFNLVKMNATIVED